MCELSDLKVVDGDQALWEVVRSVLTVLLRRFDGGEPCVFIAPNDTPFRPGELIHMHDHPELFFGVSGKGKLLLNEGFVPIECEAVTIVPRGIAHREICVDASQPYANICCNILTGTFGAHTMVADGPRIRTGLFARFSDERAARAYSYMLDACSAASDGFKSDDRAMRGLLQASLALMIEAIEKRKGFEISDRLVSRTQMFLDSHLCDPMLSVAFIAEMLGYSADYLSNRFRAFSGKRLSAHITEQRMALATRILSDASLNIAEVAHACGYQDPAYFTRLFRKHYGESPRAWRLLGSRDR